MSDHDHDHESGAHEVDNMPSRRLFNLLFGLSGLTLLACIGVVQLFNQQVAEITEERATKTSFQLQEYRDEMTAIKAGGRLVIDDDDGLTEKQGGLGPHEAPRNQMSLSEARRRVLEEPAKLLKADKPYRGWTNPDPQAAQKPLVPGVLPRGAGGRPTPGAVRPGGAPKPGAVVRPPPVRPAPGGGGPK